MSAFIDTELEESSVREYREMLELFNWDGLAGEGLAQLMLIDDLRALSDLRYRVDPDSAIWNLTVPLAYRRGLAF